MNPVAFVHRTSGGGRCGLAAVILATVTLGVAASPARAARGPVVGISDQKAGMFEDRRFAWLGVRHVRLVVPWWIELHGRPRERATVAEWLANARRRRLTALVEFNAGWARRFRAHIPTAPEYRDGVLAFRRTYPWVRALVPWNEANHCVRRRCVSPEHVARYFDVLRRACRRCLVAAGGFVTAPNLRTWIKRFENTVQHRPERWALHNYADVNRLRWSGTRRFLRLVAGPVWLTETGGIIARRRRTGRDDFPLTPGHAGEVVRFLLRRSTDFRRRIRRVYLYHWDLDRPGLVWDSALIGLDGRARPAFGALARHIGLDPRRAPRS